MRSARQYGPPSWPIGAKRVLLEQVVDRDLALVLESRGGGAPCVPRRAMTLTRRLRARGWRHRRLSRIATERAWASSPSASPSAIAAGPRRGELLRPAVEDRGALHEVEHAEARREPRRARGRQHVVGAGDIVADRLGRVGGRGRSRRRCGCAPPGPRSASARRSRDAPARCGRPAGRRRSRSANQDHRRRNRCQRGAARSPPRGSVASWRFDGRLDTRRRTRRRR